MRKISKIRKYGDKRIRHVFLFLPVTEEKEDGTEETRWLEWADIEEIWGLSSEREIYCWNFNRLLIFEGMGKSNG